MRTLALVVVVALAHSGLARADRQSAERLAAEARAERDPAKFVACGTGYTDVYNADPAAPGADEALYNAAVCFEEGKSIGSAITMLGLLRTQAPRSRLAPRALARLGSLYERIGSLSQAAELYEEYGRKYGGEKDALDAISNAIVLRAAIGDDAKQLADIQFFVRLYGAKRPREAAHAVFGLGAVYERTNRRADAVKQYRDYLRSYGTKGGPELAVRAYARLGELLWEQACPVSGLDGLCMKLVRPTAKAPGNAAMLPARCGPSGGASYAPIARDPGLVKDAAAALTAGVKAFEALKHPDATSLAVYGRMRIVLGDAQLEDHLAIRFPTNLNFSPTNKQQRDASLKRFNGYVTKKQQLGTKATQAYEAVLALKEPSSTIAAASRIATLTQIFSNDLQHAEIPADVRTGEFAREKVEAYCDALDDVGEPLAKRAIDVYDTCIVKAAELGVADRWSSQCARERARLGPATFSRTLEMVPPAPVALPFQIERPVAGKPTLPKPFVDALGEYATATATARPACKLLAGKLETIAKQHKLADAQYMAGLTFRRCDLVAEAKLAFERTLQMAPKYAPAISSLGELLARAGNVDAARQQWQIALAIDPKLFGARVNLASAALHELSRLRAGDPKRTPLEQDIRTHATSAAAIDDASPLPYAQLGLLALETPGTKQLPLARYFAGRAARLDDRPVAVALALAAVHVRDDHWMALGMFKRAAEALPRTDGASLALGLHYLKLRRWDDARAQLDTVKLRSYELLVGRGIAARGLGKHADAEARYTEAIALDAAHPAAHFNLGLLWKDYLAARAVDPATAKSGFRKAADAFRRAGTSEARQLADECDKLVGALVP